MIYPAIPEIKDVYTHNDYEEARNAVAWALCMPYLFSHNDAVGIKDDRLREIIIRLSPTMNVQAFAGTVICDLLDWHVSSVTTMNHVIINDYAYGTGVIRKKISMLVDLLYTIDRDVTISAIREYYDDGTQLCDKEAMKAIDTLNQILTWGHSWRQSLVEPHINDLVRQARSHGRSLDQISKAIDELWAGSLSDLLPGIYGPKEEFVKSMYYRIHTSKD